MRSGNALVWFRCLLELWMQTAQMLYCVRGPSVLQNFGGTNFVLYACYYAYYTNAIFHNLLKSEQESLSQKQKGSRSLKNVTPLISDGYDLRKVCNWTCFCVLYPVVCLGGGERGTCLGSRLFGGPPWGVMHMNFLYFWWKTYY